MTDRIDPYDQAEKDMRKLEEKFGTQYALDWYTNVCRYLDVVTGKVKSKAKRIVLDGGKPVHEAPTKPAA